MASVYASRFRLSGVGPGLLASLVIAAAAAFLADNYGGPVMLFALLLGMVMVLGADAIVRVSYWRNRSDDADRESVE